MLGTVQTQDETDQLEQLRKIINDPWEFLHYVYTQDEVDPRTPVKKYPVHLEYCKLLVRVWKKSRFLLVPKSRRMKVSWTMIGCYTWATMFKENRHYAFVSKKEEHADELIKRAKFIVDHLDPTIPKEFRQYEYKFNNLYFPHIKSRIQGFPQGADQLRQFTMSGILIDEMAFLEDAEKMFSASFPTLEGGGIMTGISSPSPGFFKRLVFDQLDDSGEGYEQ